MVTDYANGRYVNVSVEGLSELDYADNNWSNRSLVDALPSGFFVFSQMSFVPNFGEAGLLVVYGGENARIQSYNYMGAEALVDMADISIYDIGSRRFFRQRATGDIPLPRTKFCSVGAMAVDNSTYEM